MSVVIEAAFQLVTMPMYFGQVKWALEGGGQSAITHNFSGCVMVSLPLKFVYM